MRIAVLGAGLVGGYIGGALAAAGNDVVLIGRDEVLAPLREAGLVLSWVGGGERRVEPGVLGFEGLEGADVVLVTVKSRGTARAGDQLARLRPRGLVVSLQNGVRNADQLRETLPESRVLGGVVPFNVVRRSPTHLHRSTGGAIAVERGGGELVGALRAAGLDAVEVGDIAAVQWGKLLFNLNNAVNALAGVPLAEELADVRYRRLFAACFEEGLVAARAAGIKVAAPLKVPLALVPRVLRLPTPLFRVVARSLLDVGAEARSSMWDDLEQGRPTEIDQLNGEVVRLAEEHGLRAPVNSALVAEVRAAERAGLGSPRLGADELTTSCRRAAGG